MKKLISFPRIVFLLVCMVGVIAFTAFRQQEDTTTKKSTFRKEIKSGDEDTGTRGKRDRSLTDKDVAKMEKAMKKLDEGIAKLDETKLRIELEKVELDIKKAMNEVDWKKIERDVEAAFKNFDSEKVQAELKQQLQRIKEVDMVKVKEELRRANHDFDRQKAEMHLHGKEWKGQVEKEMKHAKEHMEQARQEMAELKGFTEQLQKDGLIDKNKGYKLEMKDGDLYINGQKQPKEKYKDYLKKGHFTINVEKGDRI